MTKRTISEILFILLLALFISLMYNTASPTGVKLIKKTTQKTADRQHDGQQPKTVSLSVTARG